MKYQHWTNDALPERFEDFVAGATETKGSWWPDWIRWLAPQSGKQVPARDPGDGIENAPGSYVKVRI
jgi:polyhydroxyalkanoate synthase subunit PhaC